MVRDPSRLFRMGLTFGFRCISGEMACYDLGGGGDEVFQIITRGDDSTSSV